MVERTKQIVTNSHRSMFLRLTHVIMLPLLFTLVPKASFAERVIGGCSAPPPPALKKFEVPMNEKLEYEISFLGSKQEK